MIDGVVVADRWFDIILCLGPDSLHAVDLMFGHHIWPAVVNAVKENRNQTGLDQLDQRFKDIAKAAGLKIFANGVVHLSFLAAHEQRDRMKVTMKLIPLKRTDCCS